MDEQGAPTRLAQKLATILPYLNERQRRLLLGAEARALGRGGITQVAQAAGVSRPTIHKALRELGTTDPQADRIRQVGGGRKKTQAHDPDLLADLERLVAPETRGDPMSPLRWTCKSTRQLALALQEQGHPVSEHLVRTLLHDADYSLQANAKTREGRQHPDRAAQFHYINSQVTAFLARGLPVISVDAKKKELVGNVKNAGQEWQPRGIPEQVQVHDFPDKTLGKAIPYRECCRIRDRGSQWEFWGVIDKPEEGGGRTLLYNLPRILPAAGRVGAVRAARLPVLG